MLGVSKEEKRKVVYNAWVEFFIERHNDLKPLEEDPMSLALIQVKSAELLGILDKEYKLIKKTESKPKRSLIKGLIKLFRKVA